MNAYKTVNASLRNFILLSFSLRSLELGLSELEAASSTTYLVGTRVLEK
jgi:hypothetical protein